MATLGVDAESLVSPIPSRGEFPHAPSPHLSGREALDQHRRGLLPKSPLARLLGIDVVEVADAAAVYTMPISDDLRSHGAALSMGSLAVLADAAMAGAALTTLGPGAAPLTATMHLNWGEAPQPDSEARAEARVVARSGAQIAVEVMVGDSMGRRLAQGGSHLFSVQHPVPRVRSGYAASTPSSAEPALDDPRGTVPLRLEGPEDVNRPKEWTAEDSLESPPLSRLFGLERVSASHGSARLTLDARQRLCPAAPRVQGGVLAMMAEEALLAALLGSARPGWGARPIDLRMAYMRRVPADGRTLTADAIIEYPGTAISHGVVHLRDSDGVVVAQAYGAVCPVAPASGRNRP